MKLERPIILASSSPRRQYLMSAVGFRFSIEKPEVDETFPEDMPVDRVAEYLARVKAESFRHKIMDEIVVAADTVVILGDRILNKPADRDEAIGMLTALSGNTHRVMTGVCMLSPEKEASFAETSEVTFENLSPGQIEYYIDHFKPFDKAGGYGAQDCLPAGMNPCSMEELKFLSDIGKESLVSETITQKRSEKGVVIIKGISGSYFNVMGLPIHSLYHRLGELYPS